MRLRNLTLIVIAAFVLFSCASQMNNIEKERIKANKIYRVEINKAFPGAEALAEELMLSPKQNAEHIMIVDMSRNDIGRVCEYGSVLPDELKVSETYSHVFHIVSNVVGTMRQDKDAIDLVKAAFPGASITGVPKVRCMEIIDELETVRRGPYTGSAGWICFSGDMDLNIIIRTFVMAKGHAFVQVGGGIVV